MKVISNDSKVLVLGSSGQVGSSLVNLLGARAFTLSSKELDFSRPDDILKTLDAEFKSASPAALINAAAYTQVDRAEQEVEIARKINGIAPGNLAKWCKDRNIPLIHYSTDYVFNGNGERPWTEEDTPSPINAYGRTKFEGEEAISREGRKWLVIRTSWVFSQTGCNFLKTMLKLGKEREEISVVSDQHGAPTSAMQLAHATLKVLQLAEMKDFSSWGIYHLSNAGETTWFGFAEKIFEIARKQKIPLAIRRVIPIPTEGYPVDALRPKNSRLSMEKAQRIFNLSMPSWEDGLQQCMKEIP